MEKISFLEISYPNFVLGAIIDPEEANQNNHDLESKINENVTLSNYNLTQVNSKAEKNYVDEQILDISGEGRTTETIFSNATNISNHIVGTSHDTRYYTKTEVNTIVDTKVYSTENIADGAITAIKLDQSLITSLDVLQLKGLIERELDRLELITILGV